MEGQMIDKIRVQHILDAIAETEKYLAGVSFEDFLSILKNGLQLLSKLK